MIYPGVISCQVAHKIAQAGREAGDKLSKASEIRFWPKVLDDAINSCTASNKVENKIDKTYNRAAG